MKIINIITGNDNGGGGEYVLNICNSDYYEAELICIGNGILKDKAINRNIKVSVFKFVDFLNGKFIRYINQNKIDIILWHGAKAFFLHKILYRKINLKSFAVKHSDFNKDFHNKRFLKRKVLTYLSKLGLKSFNEFIAVSKVISDIIEENFKYKKIYIIRNAINMNNMKLDENIKRSSLGISDNEFLFINISRLHPIKNQINLIKGFKKLLNEYPFCKLIIIGDGSERDNIELFIKDNKLAENILLLGEKENAYKYINIADANILASISEGGEPPIVLLEGGVFKVPNIYPSIGYLNQIIGDNMGYKIDPYNIESIYLTMKNVLKDDNRNIKANYFYDFIKANYSIDIFHKNFYNVFKENKRNI